MGKHELKMDHALQKASPEEKAKAKAKALKGGMDPKAADKIFQMGSELGSDVPSCIMSKDLRLNGYGKEIKRKKFPNNYYFIIIYPNFELSTKSVFEHYTYTENFNHKSKRLFFENIKIFNSLLFSAISLAPEIRDVLENLKRIRNIVAYGMSGSGSTCFGIFKRLKDIPNSSKFYDNNYLFHLLYY